MTNDETLADRIMLDYFKGGNIKYTEKGGVEYYCVYLRPPIGPFKTANFRNHLIAHLALARQEGKEEVSQELAQLKEQVAQVLDYCGNNQGALPDALIMGLAVFTGVFDTNDPTKGKQNELVSDL